jgi:hypothetical protein
MDTLIVGVGHKARNGKDTAVLAMIDAFKDKYDIRRCAFADELKREAREAFLEHGNYENLITHLDKTVGLPQWVKDDKNPPDMNDPLLPEGKYRALLQWWGTEYRRAKDPYYWVKKMDVFLRKEQPQIALIPDMRFKNEYFYVKANRDKGWTIKITRHNYFDPSINSEHPSEKELDGYKFDVNIDVNDGEVETLKKNAVQALEIIIGTLTVDESQLDFSVPKGN